MFFCDDGITKNHLNVFLYFFWGECEAWQHTWSSGTDAPCRRTHLQLVKQKNVYYHRNMYICFSQVHRFDSVMYAQLDATHMPHDIHMKLFVTDELSYLTTLNHFCTATSALGKVDRQNEISLSQVPFDRMVKVDGDEFKLQPHVRVLDLGVDD